MNMMDFPKLLGCLPPCVHQPIRIQPPAIPWAFSLCWIYRPHLWPMLNPFTCQSAINMTYGVAVYSRLEHCVLKSIFLPPFGFTLLLNHLVHNRSIKMSKWPNYFRGINNNLSVVAKLLQHPGWEGNSLLLSWCDFTLQTFVDILKTTRW